MRRLLAALAAVAVALVAAPLAAVAQTVPPRAACGPGAIPEPGLQGRVPGGSAPAGYRCNAQRLGGEGDAGGFTVLRFVDRAGRECAYYDTSLRHPINARLPGERPAGVAVLDMADPARPRRTTMLLTPGMKHPHESLALNQRRGLLAAVGGDAHPDRRGTFDVYDVSGDCRHPTLQSSVPVDLRGNDIAFVPDGRTLYVASLFLARVTAVDMSDPRSPRVLWSGQANPHGLTVSEDGNRAYLLDRSGLTILDVSSIQARAPSPHPSVVSRLSWPSMSIPQTAIPVTIGGRPYLVEVDRLALTHASRNPEPASNGDKVGAGRIIDISDERAPRVVSDLRLAVHQPEHRAAVAGDPGAGDRHGGYAGHTCNVPSRVDPGIVACAFIGSGLRLFDVRDPLRPREIAYHVPPAGGEGSLTMASAAFVRERREVWYSDGDSGLHVLRLAPGVWPGAGAGAAASPCAERTGFGAVSATPAGRGVTLGFERRAGLPVRVDVFLVSGGRERRVARFDGRTSAVRWRGTRDGYYVARFTMRDGGRVVDARRLAFRRREGRFAPRPAHHRAEACGVLRGFALEGPLFGEHLRGAYRVGARAQVTLAITRRGRVLRRIAARWREPGRTYRFGFAPAFGRRGDYRVRIEVAAGVDRPRESATLTSRRR